MTHQTVAEPVRPEDLVAEIERKTGQNVFACYQCGKCTADCPFSLTPNLVMRLLQLGEVEAATELATTWDCASCYTCQTGCPKGVSPTRVIKALRAAADGRQTAAHVSGAAKLRAQALASMPQMFSLFSKVAPLSNGVMAMPGAHGLTQLFLGVHHERSLPPFASESFPAWFASHTPAGKPTRGSVLLFHDEFMDYNYPQTGVAVTEILEKAGFGVELFHGVCCGRPMISKGLERGAAACALKNVPLLHEAASRGTYILGCEPSCLLTLRDEYLHLVPAGLEEKAKVVAGRALLIDEFLMMLHERGELALEFKKRDVPETILFHGHCHQKAFADVSKTVALLELAGYDVDFVNAACCGMAGLYGFEKDHYQASHAACERAVLPALRARPDAPVVVMGVSCRQQIEHFAGRPVRHVVEAVRDALV